MAPHMTTDPPPLPHGKLLAGMRLAAIVELARQGKQAALIALTRVYQLPSGLATQGRNAVAMAATAAHTQLNTQRNARPRQLATTRVDHALGMRIAAAQERSSQLARRGKATVKLAFVAACELPAALASHGTKAVARAGAAAHERYSQLLRHGKTALALALVTVRELPKLLAKQGRTSLANVAAAVREEWEAWATRQHRWLVYSSAAAHKHSQRQQLTSTAAMHLWATNHLEAVPATRPHKALPLQHAPPDFGSSVVVEQALGMSEQLRRINPLLAFARRAELALADTSSETAIVAFAGLLASLGLSLSVVRQRRGLWPVAGASSQLRTRPPRVVPQQSATESEVIAASRAFVGSTFAAAPASQPTRAARATGTGGAQGMMAMAAARQAAPPLRSAAAPRPTPRAPAPPPPPEPRSRPPSAAGDDGPAPAPPAPNGPRSEWGAKEWGARGRALRRAS